MKRITLISLFLSVMIFAQAEYFRFAQLTDIHISPSNPSPLEDLRRSVDDLLQDPHLAFVIATGDLTAAGDRRCLELVK
ncbi:MAG: serine/threonine protein kinase, partial [Bacteroidales bacterium]|nr:serine/threonine protein kinase [Candidatus Colicola faecequi]